MGGLAGKRCGWKLIQSGFPVSVRWPGGRCARRATGERALASIPPCQVPGPPHIPRPRPVPWRHHPSALSHHGGRGGDGGGDGGCGARGGRAGKDPHPEEVLRVQE